MHPVSSATFCNKCHKCHKKFVYFLKHIVEFVPVRLHVKSHLALGGVKNVSLNLTISNVGDDAYDTNIYFNFSREVFYINFWQKVSCGSWSICICLFSLTQSVYFRHLIDCCFAAVKYKWSRSWNDTQNHIFCIRISWISLISHCDVRFLKESLFKTTDYMSGAQSKQWSIQKDRLAREQINLKLCLSCVGCPAHGRIKNIGDEQQLFLSQGAAPLAELSCASLIHWRQTHLVRNVWAMFMRTNHNTHTSYSIKFVLHTVQIKLFT